MSYSDLKQSDLSVLYFWLCISIVFLLILIVSDAHKFTLLYLFKETTIGKVVDVEEVEVNRASGKPDYKVSYQYKDSMGNKYAGAELFPPAIYHQIGEKINITYCRLFPSISVSHSEVSSRSLFLCLGVFTLFIGCITKISYINIKK